MLTKTSEYALRAMIYLAKHEEDWPIPRTRWTEFYLNAEGHTLGSEPMPVAGSVTYAGLGDGVTFLTDPVAENTEITGPIAAKLWVSSATEDADLFRRVLHDFVPLRGRPRPGTPADPQVSAAFSRARWRSDGSHGQSAR